MWANSLKLSNIFEDKTARTARNLPSASTYYADEMNKLIDYFDSFPKNSSCEAIKELLLATQTFKDHTDPLMIDIRIKNKVNVESFFTQIVTQLDEVQKKMDALDKNKLLFEYQLLNSAKRYCYGCIRQHMSEVDQKDPVLQYYLKSSLSLRIESITKNAGL